MKFDAKESERLKREGMQAAANVRAANLALARHIAKDIAKRRGYVHADQVAQKLAARGIELGPEAGSIFRTSDWENTGEFIKSSRVSNHARILWVWRLK